MNDKYEISISTFKDVFDKVPLDARIRCLNELKDIVDSYILMTEENGDVEFSEGGPSTFEWVDDGVRSAPINLESLEGEPIKTYGG